MARVASTTQVCDAAPATVHRLLVDTTAWPVWSPHVAEVRAARPVLSHDWVGDVRAFFSPVPTKMRVTWLVDERGVDWESGLGPWLLRYRNRVEPEGTGSRLTWTADISGPADRIASVVTGPLSALGQRRRVARLARLAELLDAHAARHDDTAPS